MDNRKRPLLKKFKRSTTRELLVEILVEMKEVELPLEHESNSKVQKANKQSDIREGFLSEK